MATGHFDGAQIRIVLRHRDERVIGQLRAFGNASRQCLIIWTKRESIWFHEYGHNTMYVQLTQLQTTFGDFLDRCVRYRLNRNTKQYVKCILRPENSHSPATHIAAVQIEALDALAVRRQAQHRFVVDLAAAFAAETL